MRALVVALLGLILTGCGEKKADLVATCRAEILDHYLQPRPQGRPSDEFLVKGVSVCMMSHGYRTNDAVAACKSPATLTDHCFYPAMPIPWIRSFFE